MSARCSSCFEKLDSDDGSGLCPRCREEAAAPKAPGPRVFGRYEILSEINRGAMGIVYRAREKTLGRTVALKVLLAGEHASDEQVGRFIREAKAIARLRHPNIVPIHDVGEVDGRHYFTMDYVDGEPLSRLTAEGKIEPRQALDLVEDIADALECAHQAGVVHRDIKPSNIMIDKDGRPMIMDFGLAKPVEGGTKYTRAGTTIGTPAYMPPEQARGEIEKVGPQSDVYSIGAVLYEILTGVPPFDGDNMLDVVLDVIHEDPVPPRRRDPKINPDIQTIILHALEKDPARRYASAAELRDDIRRYKAGRAIKARPPSITRHLGRWCWRHKFEVGMTAVVGAILVGAWFLLQDSRRRMDEAARKKRLAERKLEEMKEGDKPVWRMKWKDDSPVVPVQGGGEGSRWEERDSFLSGKEFVPRIDEPFLGSVKITATVSIEADAPEDVTITCGLFSAQDARAPVAFYGVMTNLAGGPGKARVYAVPDVEQSGAAGSTEKDLTVLVERDAPRLTPGAKYLVMFERRGIDIRFQVAGEGVDEVLEVRNISFSNWRAKNLYPVIVVSNGVAWSAFRLDKLTPGKMDPFQTADSLFFIGEYNGAQSDYATIVDSSRAAHRATRARLRLGECCEIKREYERALERYARVRSDADAEGGPVGRTSASSVEPDLPSSGRRGDIESVVEARVRELFCYMALGRTDEAARALGALAERALAERERGGGDPVWDVGRGPYAWELADLAEGFVKAKMETVAAEVVVLARPDRGWSRMERTALAAGGALAKQGRSAELLALAEACPGAELAPAFAEVANSLAGSDPDGALGVLARARERYPEEGGLFSEAAAAVARKLVGEGRPAEVRGVYQTWPVESVAGVFEDAVRKAASSGHLSDPTDRATEKERFIDGFEDALGLLAFAHSVNPEHTDGLRAAAAGLARRLRDESRFTEVRRVFEAYPDSALAGELRGAIEGVTGAGDMSGAILLLDFARQNLGPGDRALEEAAARVSGKFAASMSVEDVLRVRESVAAYPARAHVPHVRKAMATLAKAGRAVEAAGLFAALRSRLPGGDPGLAEDVLGLIEGMPRREERREAFDVLTGVAPSLEHDPEAPGTARPFGRARWLPQWLVEFGDIVLRAESRPERAMELYRRASASDGGTGRSRVAATAAGRLALLLEALGKREEATRLWESLLERPGTPDGLREAARVLLARVTPESFAQWQAAHPADLSGAEMSLYLGIRALRLGLREEAVEAFRRTRRATRGRRWPYHILGRLGS